MISRSAQFYDLLYSDRDYAGQAERLAAILSRYSHAREASLLDVACGTGMHLHFLRESYRVAGLDINPALLEIARGRNPGVDFYRGDMASFKLDRYFGAITCLGGSVAATRTVQGLNEAISNMAAHLAPGGALAVEPWLERGVYVPGRVGLLSVEQESVTVTRMSVGALEDGVAVLDLHYLVGTQAGIEHFTECWELGLFSDEDYIGAFRAAGLQAFRDESVLQGKPLYVGVKPG